jgi:Family of unknown function (DUF5871)
MDSVILAKDFDIKNVRLGNLRTLDNGGKIVYVNYKGKPLIIQTPKLKAPFGLSNWEGKYSIDLSLSGYDGSNESAATFFRALTALDESMLDEGMANGMAWFKRKMPSKDVVDALYTRNVKFSKDKNTGEITDKYPPTFKVALPFRDGKFQCDVYDGSRNKIELGDIEVKGAKVTAIAQCLGLWVAGGKFGCSWKVVQLRVEPPEAINGYAFRDLDEALGDAESDIDDEACAHAPTSGRTNKIADPTHIDTSDDEGDDFGTTDNCDGGEDGDDAAVEVSHDDDLEKIAGAPTDDNISSPKAAASKASTKGRSTTTKK